MANSIKWAILVMVLTAVWVLLSIYWPGSTPHEQSAEQQAETKVRAILSTAELHAPELSVTGQTQAHRRITLRAETAGTVNTLGADEGQPVRAGDTILKLNLDDRASRVREAEAIVEQRRMELAAADELLQESLIAPTRHAATKAELAVAEANLQAAKLDVSRTHIKAPFNAVLESRLVEKGDAVQAGTALAELLDLDPILLVAEMSEQQLTGLEVGQKALASLADGRLIEGSIQLIGRSAKSSTRTFRVELQLPNADQTIADGLTGRLIVRTEPVMAHRISPGILTLGPEGQIGIKTVVDGKANFSPVRIIQSDPDGVWITGLPEQATIIVVGQDFVAIGQPVVVDMQPASSPSKTASSP